MTFIGAMESTHAIAKAEIPAMDVVHERPAGESEALNAAKSG
jgi:hypothetical protein